MIAFLGVATGAVFAVWILLAILATVRPTPRLRRLDPANLLQQWDLFAKPRSVDLVLLRRDVLRDETLTSWREVEIIGPRRWGSFIWNPGLRPKRAFVGMAAEVVRAARAQGGKRSVKPPGEGTLGAIPGMTTVPYLSLLNLVTAQSHSAVDATQFMLVAAPELAVTGRFEDANPGRVVFVSEFHRVAPADVPIAALS